MAPIEILSRTSIGFLKAESEGIVIRGISDRIIAKVEQSHYFNESLSSNDMPHITGRHLWLPFLSHPSAQIVFADEHRG